MPCPGPFHFSHSVDYIYEFCPLPDPDVGPSIFVCDVEHTSFHFGLCGRKFVLCLFGQCPFLFGKTLSHILYIVLCCEYAGYEQCIIYIYIYVCGNMPVISIQHKYLFI